MDRGRRPIPTAAGWCFGHRLRSAKTRRAPSPSCGGASQHDERRRFHSPSVLRCVSKHEGSHVARPHPSRRAHARSTLRGACASALLRMRTTEPAARRRTVFGNSHLTISNSPSRSRGAFCARGFANFASPTPNRGVGGAPRNVRVLPLSTRWTRHNAACQALARRLASHDAGRSPLGAPPWRF